MAGLDDSSSEKGGKGTYDVAPQLKSYSYFFKTGKSESKCGKIITFLIDQ